MATPRLPVLAPVEAPPESLVCIIDDDASVRRGLSRLFHSSGLTAEAFAGANDFLNRTEHDGPTCLVLDVCMPGLDGLGLQEALGARDAQIVFLSGHGDVPTCARAMKAGAIDFLTKPVDDEDLLDAVTRALTRAETRRKNNCERVSARRKLALLTPREFEVMQRVIAGLLNKQIADELGASLKTIKIHRGRVMQKMEVISVADLVRVAQAAGVTPLGAMAN